MSMNNTQRIAVGDIVKFVDVVDVGDELARMLVLEVNGDRLLVEDVCNLPIKPTCVYRTAELIKA